jgi:hypothetical protein
MDGILPAIRLLQFLPHPSSEESVSSAEMERMMKGARGDFESHGRHPGGEPVTSRQEILNLNGVREELIGLLKPGSPGG